MMTKNDPANAKLIAAAQIIRKYNLGDEKYFFSKFSVISSSVLKQAWSTAENKIKNRAIVKNTIAISPDDLGEVNYMVRAVDNNTSALLYYLNSEFDAKKLKLRDENIERRVRHIIANKYLDLILLELKQHDNLEKKPTSRKNSAFFNMLKVALVAILIIGVFSAPRIIDGLTSVEKLTSKIQEKSRYKFSGSICNDGSTSRSQGRGTC